MGHIDISILNEWRCTGKVIEKPGYGVKQALIDIFCSFIKQEEFRCGYNKGIEKEYDNKIDEFNAKARMYTQKYAQQAIFE